MSSYIPVPIETEPVDLAAEAFDYLQAKVAGWEPADGNLEAWMIEALAQIAGELRALVALVPQSIFAFYGSSILGLPPYPAIQATALTTWVAVDAAGYYVEAGTVVALTPPAAAEGYGFGVVDGFDIPAGQTTVAGVMCRALEAGTAPSGLTGTIQVIDPLNFISEVTLDAPTTGGQDAETVDAYLSRLSALLTLLSPEPILPQDFAILAQRMIPEVARAVAIDLYDASTGTPNVPRCVTVAVVDAAGEPCTPEVKQEVDDLLQSRREVNFLVFVIDPTYTTISAAASVTSYPGWDADEVAGRVAAQLTSYLSPSTWGVPPYGDATGRSWINATVVRYTELIDQVNRVDGVHYINTLTFGVQGGAQGTVDVVLPGVAPLPRPGTITAVGVPEA